MNKIIQYLRENLSLVIVVSIVAIALLFRVSAYGDVKLSIAGNDTASYITASQVPLFSSEIMTGRRLLTTNLLYKIFEPQNGYEILVNGSIDTTRRQVQPDFVGIVILQLVISLIAWSSLALVLARHLQNASMKILSVIIVLLFAFSPHIADWDSILMSESLTFSLFILEFAIFIHIGFILYNNPNARFTPWMILWMIVHFIWTFLRDTNLFSSILTISLIFTAMYFSKQLRTNVQVRNIVLFLLFISALGLITSSQSTRSIVQLRNIYHDDILVSPLRVEIFKEMGMPDRSSPEYVGWFEENAAGTLVKFMIKHPGYPITKLLRDFPLAFVGIKQTYFNAPDLNPLRETLMHIGNILHLQNVTAFFIGLLLLAGLVELAIKHIGMSRPWALALGWFFLTALLMFIPTILGDTWALTRHSLLSTMTYRLSMWLLIIIVLDIALAKTHVMPLRPTSK